MSKTSDNGTNGVVTTEVSRQSIFSGPIPPPETLAAYDALHDGLADRIVAMAESEQNHRHEITQQAVEGQISESRRGQWVGGATAIAAVVGGCAIAITASAPTGVIAGAVVACLTPMVLLVRGIIVKARAKGKGELEVSSGGK